MPPIAPLKDRVADFLRRHAPLVFCHACLSSRIGAPEKDIQDVVSQLALFNPADWRLASKMCQGCGKVDALLERLSGSA